MEKLSSNNRNTTISLLRVFSMFLILICHTIEYFTFIPGSSHLDQIFTVGVQVFFIISGFLYGSKEIKNFKGWYLKRLQRVYLPVFLLVIIVVLALFSVGTRIDWLTFLYFLFNIHGLTYLFYFNNLPMIQNLVIIWFSSVIMVCYLLIPLLQKMRSKIMNGKNPKKSAAWISLGLTAVQIIPIVFLVFNPRTVILFIIGYLLGMVGFDEKHTKLSKLIIFGAITLVLQVLRILVKLRVDNIGIYEAYRMLSHYALGLFIVYFFFYLKKAFPVLIDKIGNSKIISIIDNYSYYVFLTHGVFCKGVEFNVYEKFSKVFIATALFIVLTIISSVILKLITDGINKLITKATVRK